MLRLSRIRIRTERQLRSTRVLATVALALVLSACGPTANDTKSATAGLPNVTQQLTANRWILNRGESSLAMHSSSPITLVFTNDHRVSGTAPCNSYHGSFTVHDSTVTIKHLSQTMRACDAATMAAEHEYLAALAGVHDVAPTGRDRLELTHGAHAHLVYDAQTYKEP
jgi:heat shock protein HslJ